MLLRQFKRTGPFTIFLIVVVMLFLWSGSVIDAKDRFSLYFDIDPMPLYGIVSSIIGTHPVPGILFTMALVCLMAFMMVNLNTILFFIHERTFLPALFYILIIALFPQYQLMNPSVFGSVFLMFAIRRIMESYRIQGVAYNFFDAGLLIGIGSLFYANLIWFGIIMIAGIILLRTFNTKELLLSITGLLTPFVLTTGIYYVIGNDPADLIRILDYNIFGRKAGFTYTPFNIGSLVFTGVLLLGASLHLFMNIGSKKIQARKTFSLLIWILVTSILVWLLISSASVEMMWITAIPLSYFLSHYFVFLKKKLMPEILFSLFFLMIIYIQSMYLWYLK
ncbi:MAG TPA: DUF6427 family protein [Bacteroidales bacterium]|nr:DUF6427 family protein [Bacteroidales bacterium]